MNRRVEDPARTATATAEPMGPMGVWVAVRSVTSAPLYSVPSDFSPSEPVTHLDQQRATQTSGLFDRQLLHQVPPAVAPASQLRPVEASWSPCRTTAAGTQSVDPRKRKSFRSKPAYGGARGPGAQEPKEAPPSWFQWVSSF